MPTSSSREPRVPEITSTQVVLRAAKRLHRAATSDSPSTALPVLRRLLAAGAVPAGTLPKLFQIRDTVQRKHVLRTLAFEAGHQSWEAYCRVLPQLDVQQVRQTVDIERGASTLKLWFASPAQAEQFAATHGGRALVVGKQAVVVPAAEAADADEER